MSRMHCARRRFFYGWTVAAGAWLSYMLNQAAFAWGFTVFVNPLAEEYGWSRTSITIAWVLSLSWGLLLGPWLGRVFDRYGARPLILSFTADLWASPDYLAQRGTPRAPADLDGHDCLIFSRLARQGIRLSDGRQKAKLPSNGRISVDDTETLRTFVLQGAGIGTLPDFLCRSYVRDSTRVRVLPKWSWTTGALSFVYPSQPFVPAKVRAFTGSRARGRKHVNT